MRFWQRIVSRRVHELELQRRDEQIGELRHQVEYFRVRMERLNDAALARKGEIHEPTMRDPRLPKQDLGGLIASALSITEIDSTLKKGS